MKFRGWHDVRTLPVKHGDTVEFLKGTVLRSMQRRKLGTPYEATRRQKVEVHHVLPGSSILLGYLYSDGEFIPERSLRDVRPLAEQRGFKFREGVPLEQSATAMYEFLRQHEDTGAHDPLPGEYKAVWLATSNPRVCWAGSGGYWVSADINDCTLVEDT